MDAGVPTIIMAGREYGSGSSRDWAAKAQIELRSASTGENDFTVVLHLLRAAVAKQLRKETRAIPERSE
eukprot:1194576-Prorocentrum_minimum.AAC.6